MPEQTHRHAAIMPARQRRRQAFGDRWLSRSDGPARQNASEGGFTYLSAVRRQRLCPPETVVPDLFGTKDLKLNIHIILNISYHG